MSCRDNNISEFLKPLINLGNEIDNKVKKIARNDFSETSIEESWKIARHLGEDSRHLKRECKQSLTGMKENVEMLDKFGASRSQLLQQTWEYMENLRKEMKEKYNYESIPVPIRKIERTLLKAEKSPQITGCSTNLQLKEEEMMPKEKTETAEQCQEEELKVEIKEVAKDGKDEASIQDGYSSSPEVPKFLQQFRKEVKTISGDSPELPDEFYRKEKTTSSNVCRGGSLKEKPMRVRSFPKTPQQDWDPTDKNYYNSNNNYEEDDDDDFYLHSNKVALKGRSPTNAAEVGDFEDMTITKFTMRKPPFKTPERPKFLSQLYKLKNESDDESQVTPILDTDLCTNSSIQREIEKCVVTPKAENFYLKQFKTSNLHDDIETPTPPPSEVYQQKDTTSTTTSRGGSFLPNPIKSTTIGPVHKTEFEGLKSYEFGLLCLEEVNGAIGKINQLIINKSIYPSHLQSLDIRRACGLESKTSQFIISLLKLGRLSETEQDNVYRVRC